MDELMHRKEDATASQSLVHYNLDDGYGSSNSSPHSIVQAQYCGPGGPTSLKPLIPPTSRKKDQYTGGVGLGGESINLTIEMDELEDRQSKRRVEVRLVDGVLTSKLMSTTKTPRSPTPDENSEKKSICSRGGIKGGRGDDKDRETWGSNMDFLLSIIGFAVDLANVWRFPYLCYKNGGGAFLIPYSLMLVFGAIPLFYMELVLGQYNRQGPITIWKICPIFKGVGVCAVMVAFFVSFYYNVIIAWALYFLVASFSPELPWLHCNNTWNSDLCNQNTTLYSIRSPFANNTTDFFSFDSTEDDSEDGSNRQGKHTPASEFFNRAVLEMHKSEGLHDLGVLKWQLAICVFIVYVTLYLSLFKGVKSTGKVVWFTATMPYVVLTILLARGLALPGALTGIKYYLQPEMSKLKETGVWVDAAIQIFYSVGAGFGVHLSYASYNNFNNNCYTDCIITSVVNSFTSFFSGFVIFTYLGFMSHKQGIPISEVASEGPGLVFEVYPEAVATLPGSNFWSVLFFFMLITLGLDSGMGGLECIITGVIDEYGVHFKKRKYTREIFTAIIVGTSFCIALINVTYGGVFFFHLLDAYAGGLSLLCSVLFEAIAVSWFYGLDRFMQDVQEMLGHRPGLYWRICWKFISPLLLTAVIISALFSPSELTYGTYVYPGWARAIGISLGLTSFFMIPCFALYKFFQCRGNLKQKFALSVSPEDEHDEIISTGVATRLTLAHWLYL